jgi:glucose-1-phosphate thymidylyltransferase
MKVAKAILMAGSTEHTGDWPGATVGPLQLFPVANRPILFHQLERLRRGGLREATILVDRHSADPIRRAVGDGTVFDLAIRYDEHPDQGGLVCALATCRDFVGDAPVFVQEADALLRGHLHRHLTMFSQDRLDALALSVPSPLAPGASPLPPGYVLSERALDVLLQRPDAAGNPLHEVRASGGRVREETVDGCLPCHGDLDTLLDGNRQLLEELVATPIDANVKDSVIQGQVSIHPSAIIHRSTVRGPVVIGPGVRLVDAYVGPYTSLGAAVEIEGAEIEHSIVLQGAQLRSVGTRIESSVIGQGARVARTFTRPSSMRLALGDGGEILLS